MKPPGKFPQPKLTGHLKENFKNFVSFFSGSYKGIQRAKNSIESPDSIDYFRLVALPLTFCDHVSHPKEQETGRP